MGPYEKCVKVGPSSCWTARCSNKQLFPKKLFSKKGLKTLGAQPYPTGVQAIAQRYLRLFYSEGFAEMSKLATQTPCKLERQADFFFIFLFNNMIHGPELKNLAPVLLMWSNHPPEAPSPLPRPLSALWQPDSSPSLNSEYYTMMANPGNHYTASRVWAQGKCTENVRWGTDAALPWLCYSSNWAWHFIYLFIGEVWHTWKIEEGLSTLSLDLQMKYSVVLSRKESKSSPWPENKIRS